MKVFRTSALAITEATSISEFSVRPVSLLSGRVSQIQGASTKETESKSKKRAPQSIRLFS